MLPEGIMRGCGMRRPGIMRERNQDAFLLGCISHFLLLALYFAQNVCVWKNITVHGLRITSCRPHEPLHQYSFLHMVSASGVRITPVVSDQLDRVHRSAHPYAQNITGLPVW